jgi:hypothetical protein
MANVGRPPKPDEERQHYLVVRIPVDPERDADLIRRIEAAPRGEKGRLVYDLITQGGLTPEPAAEAPDDEPDAVAAMLGGFLEDWDDD